MGLFVLGFFGGSLAVLAWGHLKKKSETFDHFLHRELAVPVQSGRLPESKHVLLGGENVVVSPPARRRFFSENDGGGRMRNHGLTSGYRQAPSVKKEQVLELHEQGYPEEQILRETCLGKGAVDLILTMQKKGMF